MKGIFIFLPAEHLPGSENTVADSASRIFNDSTEWTIDSDVYSRVVEQYGPFSIDFFASRLNAKQSVYASWQPDPEALFVDAFSRTWKEFNNFYTFPPFSLVLRCLQKVSLECYYSSHVANPTMVPEIDSNASLRSITLTKKCTQPSVQQCNVSQITQGLVPSCLSNIRTYFRSKGLSERSINILCHSWRSSTVKQYQIYYKKWLSFCGVRKENPMLYNETLVIEFLTHLFHESGKYSAINSARSALSTFLINEYGITIGNSSLVKRFLRGIFELNPPVARYCMGCKHSFEFFV